MRLIRPPARPAALVASTAVMALSVAVLAAPTAVGTTAPSAAPAAPAASAAPGRAVNRDLKPVPTSVSSSKRLPVNRADVHAERRQNRSMSASEQAAAAADAAVGDTKSWLALDDVDGGYYVKDFTLRSIGDHIQVWVADDRAFPEGDCRNDLDLTAITDEQVAGFVSEFDGNIYPKESEAFSVPESLDGAAAPLAELLELPADYYQVPADQADDIVVMVDNVRDSNYYDPLAEDGNTYIAGFFSPTLNFYANRNIMTIDAFDWLHRTGATPPDDSADPAYLACSAAQDVASNRTYGSPRPRLYEGVFAHEYQHLLESYEDADEQPWINEGLSDYAQTLVGYVDTRTPTDDPLADSHIAAFTGFLGEDFGGPENSLTRWEDQGGPEVLADYGAAYSFMMYLESHYGEAFMSALHREDANGIAGLAAVLDQFGKTRNAQGTIRDWSTTMAVDAALDQRRSYRGRPARWYVSSSQLSSKINWDTPQAYDTPGAPSNGSDYVRLRNAGGDYLTARQVRSMSFTGAKTLEALPLEWEVDTTPPDAITADTTCGAVPDGTGAAALYSGCGSNLDRSAVQAVDVPAAGGTLSFDALWDIETDYDFGFVQVSTDGGATWTSLATEDTTTSVAADVSPSTVALLPGFSGESDGWRTQTADLSAYAGQSVLLAFRYVTDPGVDEAGFWVRNVDVAGTALSTDTVDGWQSVTQISPISVPGYTVRLIAYDDAGNTRVRQLRLRGKQAVVPLRWIRAAIGTRATTVAATVMMDDPSESLTQYGRYTLTVNGVVQPGG